MKRIIEAIYDIGTPGILIFLIFYISLDSLLFGTNSNTLLANLLLFSYVIFSFYCFAYLLNNKELKKNKSPLALLLILLFLSCLLNFDFTGGYLIQASLLIIACFISNKLPLDVFIEKSEKIIFYIAFISLSIYIIYILVPQFFSLFPIITNTEDYAYRFVIFNNIPLDDYLILRNYSFFREPGVFVIPLIYSLLINLFYYDRPKRLHVLIILLSVITSLSTAGIVLVVVSFGVYSIRKINIRRIILFFLLLTFGWILYLNISESEFYIHTIGKFNEDNPAYGSTQARYASAVIPLIISERSPIWGVGLNNYVLYYNEVALKVFSLDLRAGAHSTNTLLSSMAMHGVIYGLMCALFLFHFVKQSFNKQPFYILCLIFLIFVLLISNEDVRLSLFYNILLFYGANSIFRKRV